MTLILTEAECLARGIPMSSRIGRGEVRRQLYYAQRGETAPPLPSKEMP